MLSLTVSPWVQCNGQTSPKVRRIALHNAETPPASPPERWRSIGMARIRGNVTLVGSGLHEGWLGFSLRCSREFPFATVKQRNGLLIRGIVVIDEGGELGDADTQGDVLDTPLLV